MQNWSRAGLPRERVSRRRAFRESLLLMKQHERKNSFFVSCGREGPKAVRAPSTTTQHKKKTRVKVGCVCLVLFL